MILDSDFSQREDRPMSTVARTTPPRADVGAAVRALREKSGVSREQLAVAAGISYDSIRRLERGFIPRADRLAAIAEALDTTVEDLLRQQPAA
jgi:transcriptional regulator with XRE-family HTH domain